MRLIIVGCEYSGVTTLINGLYDWGNARGVHHHLDDHFTIPDAYHLSDEEQKGMLDMLPAIKERFQRFQIAYHVRLITKYSHILLGGFYLEEAVYGPRYYYPGKNSPPIDFEADLPDDVILVHLHARPDVIRARMESDPHPHQLVPSEDVEEVLEAFELQIRRSWIRRQFAIDTSDLTPEELLETFLDISVGHLNAEDGNTRLLKP
ncbi:MAG: hypothetical protein CME19_10095 [Gemmatimonadetes bacterium]|nr:hypothetical protein [Gemmatimonadota bacterium]|tara:strand:- start:719 stop:1336 length:618 start_codon:yes stop_codon:yes gene_type:complete